MQCLTEIQLQTVCATYAHRVVTRPLLEILLADGRSTGAWTQHLARLETRGMLERVRYGQGPIWIVTEKGAATAEASGRVPVRAWRPGDGIKNAPAHTLHANTVGSLFLIDSRRHDDECDEAGWEHEILHRNGKERIITDMRLEYTRIRMKRVVTWTLLVEIDCGTRKITDLYRQVQTYARLQAKRPAWARFYRTWPRVLIVLTQPRRGLDRARRLRELCAADDEIGPETRAAITTMDLMTRDGPLAEIWLPLGAPALSPAVALDDLRSVRRQEAS